MSVYIYMHIYICIYLYIYIYIHTYICSAPPPRSPAMFFILYIGVWNGMNGEWQWQWYERNNNQTFLANGTEWRLWISGNFSPEPWLAQVLSKSTGNRLVSFVFSSLPKVYTHFSKIWTLHILSHIITYFCRYTINTCVQLESSKIVQQNGWRYLRLTCPIPVALQAPSTVSG